MPRHSILAAHVNKQPLVLLVEGHALLRETLEHILRSQLGLDHFEYVASGEAAIQKTAEQKPWLVVIDFSLPDISGLEAARRILDRAPDIHVILLIEAPETAYRAAAEAVGVTTCVAKTLLRDDLPRVVARLLEQDAPNPGTNNRSCDIPIRFRRLE